MLLPPADAYEAKGKDYFYSGDGKWIKKGSLFVLAYMRTKSSKDFLKYNTPHKDCGWGGCRVARQKKACLKKHPIKAVLQRRGA